MKYQVIQELVIFLSLRIVFLIFVFVFVHQLRDWFKIHHKFAIDNWLQEFAIISVYTTQMERKFTIYTMYVWRYESRIRKTKMIISYLDFTVCVCLDVCAPTLLTVIKIDNIQIG